MSQVLSNDQKSEVFRLQVAKFELGHPERPQSKTQCMAASDQVAFWKDPRTDPKHTGGIMYPICPGNASSRRSLRIWREEETCGVPCLDCYNCNLDPVRKADTSCSGEPNIQAAPKNKPPHLHRVTSPGTKDQPIAEGQFYTWEASHFWFR